MLVLHTCKRLIVYGGSFDPPHRAHVELPFLAARQVGADGVLFVPAGQPPHKPGREVAPAHHRLAMLRLALGDRPDAAICTFEIDRPGPSYTVETIEHLRGELGPAVELRLLIGADMAVTFDQWHRPDRVIELAKPLVMVRPPYNLDALPDPRWRGWAVHIPVVDIASTRLRELIRGGRWDDPQLTGNTDPVVLRYIRENGLYS